MTTEPKTSHSSISKRLFTPILLIVILFGALYVYNLQQQLLDIQTQLKHTQQTINKTHHDFVKQNDYELNLTRTFETLTNKKIATLNATLQEALAQRWFQSHDWLRLKARYALELAGINAHWTSDAQTTLALLSQADEALEATQDQDVLPIRQSIAQEKSAMLAVEPFDMVGLLSQIDGIAHELEQLPFKKPTVPKITQPIQPNLPPSTWQTALQSNLAYLQRLFVIQHHDAIPPRPTLPQETALLRGQLLLTLNSVQWAAIQKNQDVYNFLLKQIHARIQTLFDHKHTHSILKQIETLQEKQLSQPAPSIEQSLRLLNQLIESQPESKGAQAS